MDTDGQGPAPSRAVIETVAEIDNVNPVDLDPPLAKVIDTDALDRLFASQTETTGRVTFQYREYHVTVRSNGDVTAHNASGPPE